MIICSQDVKVIFRTRELEEQQAKRLAFVVDIHSSFKLLFNSFEIEILNQNFF